jgi:antitoxin CcdA
MGKDELKPNLAVDPQLLADAEAAGIAPADVAEAALRAALDARRPSSEGDDRARRWAEENAEAIADYNRRIRERGVISDDFRKW